MLTYCCKRSGIFEQSPTSERNILEIGQCTSPLLHPSCSRNLQAWIHRAFSSISNYRLYDESSGCSELVVGTSHLLLQTVSSKYHMERWLLIYIKTVHGRCRGHSAVLPAAASRAHPRDNYEYISLDVPGYPCCPRPRVENLPQPGHASPVSHYLPRHRGTSTLPHPLSCACACPVSGQCKIHYHAVVHRHSDDTL